MFHHGLLAEGFDLSTLEADDSSDSNKENEPPDDVDEDEEQ